MIKMTRVYGDMYAPREYCTFTNPVTSGGTEEVDYVDMPCENGCENYKEIRKGPRGGKKGICRILRPSEVRNGRARACKRFREQNEQTTGKETV